MYGAFGGAFGGAICLYYVGAYIKISAPADHPTTKLSPGGISAMAFFYMGTIFYTPSWNGTPWVYNSEMLSQNLRTLGQTFSAASNWHFNFLIARFTPEMFSAMCYGVYFFFACLMMCSIVFMFFLLPETKGVPLESMDRLFSKELKPWNAHKIVMGELRADDESFRKNIERSGVGLTKDGGLGEKKGHIEEV